MRERKNEKELVIKVIITGADAEVLQDKPAAPSEGILSHKEGVDLIPSNIELLSMEIQLVNAMSREVTLKNYIKEASAAGVSIYAYDRNNAACKVYEALTKGVRKIDAFSTLTNLHRY